MPYFEIKNVPKHMYKEITELAKTNNRSTSKEIISLLKKALNLKKENKINKKELLKKIKIETENELKKEKILDPTKLIRKDRER